MLEAGWTTTPQKAKKEISDEEKELRDKAKELGISHYWTKSVETLKAEIYGEDSVDPV